MHRANNFDFIRLVAASMVIIGHAYPILGQSGIPVLFRVSVSTYAVQLFFALSGYLVVQSWVRDPNVIRFVAKRALRILPGLIGVVVLAACVLGPLVTRLEWSVYFDSRLFHLYFENTLLKIRYSLPGVFEDNIYPNAVNGSLWSLPAEAFMYLLVLCTGILAFIGNQRWFTPIWIVFSAGGLALHAALITFGSPLFSDAVVYLTSVRAVIEMAPFFFVGGCIALFKDRIFFSAGFAVLLWVGGYFLARTEWPIDSLLVLFTSYSVIAFGSAAWPVLKHFGRFGDLSYGVYLYGFPLAQTLSWGYGRDLSFANHIILTLLASYLFAFASWHLIEKRALRIKPKRRL
jgi:peptidoglycan/LPS O-acetylase OafA/YrhL